MKISTKMTGFNSVNTMLRSVGERVPDGARGQMKRAAARIVKRAQLYVPEDEEALKNSIRVEKSYGTRGRLQIDVVAGIGSFSAGTRLVDISQYAWIIHELYEQMEPGERTKAKRAANPSIYIGERFMDRAAEDEEKGLSAKLVDTITAIIPKGYRT